MEGAAESVVVEQVESNESNKVLLFLLFIPTLAVVYLVPLLGTIYARQNARKWIAYWIIVLILNYLLRPVLVFIFGAAAGAFLFLVLALAVLYLSNNEKASLLVEAGDLLVTVGGEQYEKLMQYLSSQAKQYGLIE